MWIDTHCHLDDARLAPDLHAVRARARQAGVGLCVIPAVQAHNFERVRQLAHELDDAYALGIHPMCVASAADADLQQLDAALSRYRDDARLVAVGEIGLDYFLPELKTGPLRQRQAYFYREQLKIASRHGLPVLLHVRRSVDQVLKGLRDIGAVGGIAHAFNGSRQQAGQFLQLGFKLGFGGAVTFERAIRLRQLAAELPPDAIVMETDAPDIPPQWIYRTAAERAQGLAQGRNDPAQLPRIAAAVAALQKCALQAWQKQTSLNARTALPRLHLPRILP